MEAGGFAVIMLLYAEAADAPALFAQVAVIVGNVRGSDPTTAVVVCGPPHGDEVDNQLSAIRRLGRVYFVEGDVNAPATLERAGLRTAAQLLTLAPPSRNLGGD